MDNISEFKKAENTLLATKFNINNKSIFISKTKYQKFKNNANFCNIKNTIILNKSGEKAYYAIIVISSVMSIISMLCICLIVPTMYNYVATISTFSMQDFSYCENAVIDVQSELIKVTKDFVLSSKNRTKRNNYGYNPTLFQQNVPFFQECPACCIPGERGPIGDLGLPGLPGNPGPDGALGRPGTTPNVSCIPERVFEPPPCLPCPQGPRGPPGHPGFPGQSGNKGISGRPGLKGSQGKPGEDGAIGPDGPPGITGLIGDKGITPEAHIIPGPPGEVGEIGSWGPPGNLGSPGEDGYSGSPGEKGWPGSPGQPGIMGSIGLIGRKGEQGPPGTPGTCICQDTEVVVTDTHNINSIYKPPVSSISTVFNYKASSSSNINEHSLNDYNNNLNNGNTKTEKNPNDQVLNLEYKKY